MQQTPQKLGRVDPAGAGGLIGGRSQKSVGCLQVATEIPAVTAAHCASARFPFSYCKRLAACYSCEFASPLHAAGGRAASAYRGRGRAARPCRFHHITGAPDGLDAGRDCPSHHHLNDLHVSTVHCRIEDQRLCTGSRCIEPRHLAAHPAVIRAGSPASRVPALLLCSALPLPLPLPSALRRSPSVSQRHPACAPAPPVTVLRLDVSSGPQPAASALVLRDSALPYTRLHSVGKVPVDQWWLRPARIPITHHALPLHTLHATTLLDTAPSPQVASPSAPLTPASAPAPAPPPQPAWGPYCTSQPAYLPCRLQHPQHRAGAPPSLRCCWTDCSHGPTE